MSCFDTENCTTDVPQLLLYVQFHTYPLPRRAQAWVSTTYVTTPTSKNKVEERVLDLCLRLHVGTTYLQSTEWFYGDHPSLLCRAQAWAQRLKWWLQAPELQGKRTYFRESSTTFGQLNNFTVSCHMFTLLQYFNKRFSHHMGAPSWLRNHWPMHTANSKSPKKL